MALAGWRAIFWTLVGVGLADARRAVHTARDAAAPSGATARRWGARFVRYGELLRHRPLLGYAGAGGFFYGGMFAYIAGTPFAYITYHHVLAAALRPAVRRRYRRHHGDQPRQRAVVTRIGSDRLLRAGHGRGGARGRAAGGRGLDRLGRARGAGRAAVSVRLGDRLHRRQLDRRRARRLPRARRRRLSAGRRVQYGSGIVGSALVGAFADGTPWPMGWVIALAGIGSLLCARLLVPAHAPGTLSETANRA